MTDTTETPAQEAPQGLDNIISAAIDTHFVEETPTEAAPAEAAPETTDSRPRDEHGRFTKAEAKASEGTAVAPTTPDVAAPVEQPKALDAPAHYTAEQKAAFATLPREAQEYWVRTEKEREADFTRRSQEAAELKRTVAPIAEAVAPYQQYLQQIAPSVGQTPAQMINSILAAEYALRTGDPQTKAATFAQLAQAYGINLAAFTGGQMPAQHQPQVMHDPRILQKIQEHDRILAEQKREQELQVSHKQIDAFAQEKDEAGQPKHPYFDRVRHVMASIVQSGQADNLADAYKLATEPIRDVIDKEIKARQTAAEKERTEALERAKKAAPVKTSSGVTPKGGTSPKGLDAHISAAIERAGLA